MALVELQATPGEREKTTYTVTHLVLSDVRIVAELLPSSGSVGISYPLLVPLLTDITPVLVATETDTWSGHVARTH